MIIRKRIQLYDFVDEHNCKTFITWFQEEHPIIWCVSEIYLKDLGPDQLQMECKMSQRHSNFQKLKRTVCYYNVV